MIDKLIPCPRCSGEAPLMTYEEWKATFTCALCSGRKQVSRELAAAYLLTETDDTFYEDTVKMRERFEKGDL